MKKWIGVVGILLVVGLFALSVYLNYSLDHKSYALSGVPHGYEVGEDEQGPYSQSPRLQIRTDLANDDYLVWKRNQNLRRLCVIPALAGVGILFGLLRLYERSGTPRRSTGA